MKCKCGKEMQEILVDIEEGTLAYWCKCGTAVVIAPWDREDEYAWYIPEADQPTTSYLS